MGSLAGSALFPTQLPPGPKISDNRTTTSVVGGPISLIFGTANVAGTVMWLAPYVQNSSESGGGKGGPQQQTFSYTQSIAIGLGERVDDSAPDDIGAIAGLTRVWENGAIVYDIRPQQQASSETNTLAETDAEYASRLAASAAYAETFTLYIGDELQEADPTIQATQGVENTPAFRGLAYIVYPNRNLTIAQGLRHPNFQFEVYANGVGGCVETPLASTSVLYPWLSSSWQDPTNENNTNTFAVEYIDGGLASIAGLPAYPYLGSPWPSLGAALDSVAPYYRVPLINIGYSSQASMGGVGELTQTTGTGAGIPTPDDYVTSQANTVCTYFNFKFPNDGFFTDYQRGGELIPIGPPNPMAINVTYHQGVDGVDGQLVGTLAYTAPADDALFPPWPAPWVNGGEPSSGAIYFFLYDVKIQVTRGPSAPLDPCAGLPPSAFPGYAVQLDGSLIKCGPWTHAISGPATGWKSMSTFPGVGGGSTRNYPWNPTIPSTDPNYSNATFWTDAYDALVAAGKMPTGLVYGTDYPVGTIDLYTINQVICEGAGATASVASIIAAICKRSGLTAIDVSDLEETFVNGYAISSVCTGSSIITPLRSIAFFDAVETDGVIKFAARGKPIVATFTTNDFGCYDASQSVDSSGPSTSTDQSGFSTCPPSITTTRSQDEDLPRSIRFHYIATSRDYEDAEQDSPFRFATQAINDVDITVAVCLDDTRAAQCASVLWADSWAARSAYQLAIDQSWLKLDVGDCIAVPIDGVIQRLRISNDTNSSAVLRKLSCVKDDDGAYISFAVSTPPQRVPQILNFIAPASYELLDLPCLVDADSDPGFYIAAQQAADTPGIWRGATFYKSIDAGATYSSLFSLITEATIGTLATPIPESQAYTWDDTTVIVVNVPDGFSFESRTDDAVIAGANAAAMGADRRWEIVQFANAVQLTANQWLLSRLLRGRRGTEHVMGSSQVGDVFVIISTGDLGRVVLQTTEIGTARTYRGTPIGGAFATGTTEVFAGHAQALVPFSPVDASANRLTDGDVSISWLRRSRLGRTLMSGVDIPLGETVEAFQVDIIEHHSPASPAIVLRTLLTSTTSVVYTHAQQETDFGSPLPTDIKVAIYQMSSVVGRGTPLITTLDIT